MLCNASTRAKADGKDWEYWAELKTKNGDPTTETAKNFVSEYLFPYINYFKTAENGEAYHIYLNDGTVFSVKKGVCFDMNGAKKPNKAGKDRFRFVYCPYTATANWESSKGKITAYRQTSMKTREQLLSFCKRDGIYCSGLLEFDGWEFKKDYPAPRRIC